MKYNYLKFSFLLIFLVFGYTSTYSQLPMTLWAKVYNGPANLQDSSVSVCVNSNGDVFVTGWSLSTSNAEDIVTIKYNPNSGDTMWVKRLSGAGQDKPTSMTCDNNAVYVTGWTFQGTNRDIITIKYNAATGDTTWVKRYNGSNNGGDYGFAVASDAAGNVYVAGRSDVNGQGQKLTVLKYDASGNVPSGWPVIYNGPLSTTFDEGHAISVDAAGNVYVTGQAGTTGADDFLTLKINSAGSVQWAKRYNGNQNSEDNALTLVLDNTAANVYVGGYGYITGQQQNYVVIKYSAATGDSLAFATYQGTGSQIDILTAMAIDPANNVYVTGYSTGVGTGYDYATVKYNSSLAQQWVKRTTDGGSDFPWSIVVGDTSAVYVTGSSVGTGTGYDYLTIKYRSDGSESWRKRENGSASSNDYASHVAYYDVDHVYVTGSANFNGIGIAYYTLRYSNVTGIEPISTQVPASFTLSQNYPNPFNPTTTIKFDIPKQTFVKVAVYDVMGREVELLGNEMVKAGQYKVTWDASKYSSGIYFYKLITDSYSETKKMILVK